MTDINRSMTQALLEAKNLLEEFVASGEGVVFLEKFAGHLVETFESGGKVLIAGNGGSQADALHFAEEFTGRYRDERRPLPVMALGEATHVTCTSNDYGFENIFSRQVDAFGKKNDLLVLLSTSGNSKNLIQALESAKTNEMKVVSLLGKGGGTLKAKSDLEIIVPGQTSDRIQELHMMLLHMVIEAVERTLFPENYK